MRSTADFWMMYVSGIPVMTSGCPFVDHRRDRGEVCPHGPSCICGSHRINGVAALHSDLLTKTVLKDLYDLYPDRFVNVTNGVTPRRWIALSNPGLTELITGKIGDGWIKHFEDEIRKIEPFAKDPAFRAAWGRSSVATRPTCIDHTGKDRSRCRS